MGDIFDDMVGTEIFIERVASGVPVVNAGIEVGWSPSKTRHLLKDPDFAEIVAGSIDRANATIEEALYAKAAAGNVAAIQLWLFNREPDRWRDVRRIEIRNDTRVSIAAVASVKAGVLELLREQGAEAMQELGPGEIVIDDDER